MQNNVPVTTSTVHQSTVLNSTDQKLINITEPTSANPSTDAGAGAEGTALDLDEGNWRFGIRCRYP